jgi:hypothetical protein
MRGLCIEEVDLMKEKSGDSAVVPGDGVIRSGVVVREPIVTEGIDEYRRG